MKIDQVGLSPGVPGQARRDGLSTGAIVTLTDTTAGGTTLFEILWVDPLDTTTVVSLAVTGADHVWQFHPTAGVTGPIRIQLIHTLPNGLVTYERRIFGIPDVNGRVVPAPGERAATDATLLNAEDSAIIAASERNWPLTDFPLGNPFGWAFDAVTPIQQASGGSSQLYLPPEIPGVLDDEFDSDTLNPAWQFYDDVASVVRTPTLGINLFSSLAASTTPPRYSVNASGSNARKSWLYVQPSDEANLYYVTKPATVAVGQWVFTRIRGPGWAFNSNTLGGGVAGLVICGTTSGHPDSTKMVTVRLTRSSQNLLYQGTSFDAGAGGTATTVLSSSNSNGPGYEYFGIYRRTSTSYMMFMWNEGGNFGLLPSNSGPTGLINISTMDRVGFIMSNNAQGAPTLPLGFVGADFIRQSASLPF